MSIKWSDLADLATVFEYELQAVLDFPGAVALQRDEDVAALTVVARNDEHTAEVDVLPDVLRPFNRQPGSFVSPEGQHREAVLMNVGSSVKQEAPGRAEEVTHPLNEVLLVRITLVVI